MGLVALWHVESPGPGIKFMSPALAGRFLSTASLGRSQTLSCYSTVYGLDQAGSFQSPGHRAEEGSGHCHSPLTWI